MFSNLRSPVPINNNNRSTYGVTKYYPIEAVESVIDIQVTIGLTVPDYVVTRAQMRNIVGSFHAR